MVRILLASVLALFTQTIAAHEFDGDITYEPTTQTLTVDLVFEGTDLSKHNFSLASDGCATDESPNGLSFYLMDAGWNDRAKQTLRTTLTYDLKDWLAACETEQVRLTVRLHKRKVRTILISR